MQRRAYEIEFRTRQGHDRLVRVDVWTDIGRQRAVLVLRNLPLLESDYLEQASAVVHTLNEDWLPYVLRPGARLLVLALHPPQENRKARALVLPLSA